jgi:hypothetical protein
MLFRTYDDFTPIEPCVICLEILNENNQVPIKLHDFSILNYQKLCKCNVFVHKTCLSLYYEKWKKCIICHKEVNTNNLNDNQNNTTCYKYLNNIYRSVLNIFRITQFLSIYLLFKMYFVICDNLKIKYS